MAWGRVVQVEDVELKTRVGFFFRDPLKIFVEIQKISSNNLIVVGKKRCVGNAICKHFKDNI